MYLQHRTLQWCWAHLKRDFQALIDSGDGQTKRLGHDLMRETGKLFAEYAKCRNGTIKYSTLQKNLRPVRQQVEALLLRGFGTAAHGMCKQLYKHRDHLWTFLSDLNVEPTNNCVVDLTSLANLKTFENTIIPHKQSSIADCWQTITTWSWIQHL
jgi:transposase